MSKADRRYAAFIALVSVVLYGAIVLTLFPAGLQFAKYPRAAEQYLAGTLPAERILDFSPFYFYLHVVQDALTSAYVVVFLQLLALGAASAVLFLILRRLFPLWIAFAGSAAFVLHRGVMVYSAVLEPEVFLLFFLLSFLFFAQARGERHPWYAGLALALCVAVRPSVLPLLFVLPLHYFLNERPRWRAAATAALAPSLALLLMLSVSNGVATGSYSPLGMNPGFVFFEGNNPLSSGRSSVYPPIVGELKDQIPDHPDNPHLTYRLVAEREIGRDLSTGEANRFWRRKATAYLADHPGRYFLLLGTKARAVLQNYRRHDLVPAERFDELLRARIPALPFAFVVAAAVVGLVVTIGAWRQQLLLYALLGSQVVLMLLFYVSERQRLAALPAFIVFGAFGLSRLSNANGRARLGLLTAMVSIAVGSLLPSAGTREDRHLWSAHEIANRAMELARSFRDRGEWDEARQATGAGFAAAPWWRDYARPAGVSFGSEGIAGAALATMRADANPSRRLDRAQLLIAAHRWEEAEAILTALIAEGERFDRGYYQSSQPEYYMAQAAVGRGRFGDAEKLLLSALKGAPGDPFVLAMLAALTGDRSYEERITRYFGESHADFLVGVCLLRLGRPGAAHRFERTVERLPDYWRAQVYLAAAVGGEGDLEKAASLYHRATGSRAEPAMLEEAIVPIFASLVEQNAGDLELRIRFAFVLAQYGRFDEAVETLRAAEAGSAPAVAGAITEIERMRAGVR